MNSTLHADLGGTSVPRFDSASDNFFGTYVIGTTAQVFTELAFRKRTELTLKIANIGVINVSVYYIADCIAVALLS